MDYGEFGFKLCDIFTQLKRDQFKLLKIEQDAINALMQNKHVRVINYNDHEINVILSFIITRIYNFHVETKHKQKMSIIIVPTEEKIPIIEQELRDFFGNHINIFTAREGSYPDPEFFEEETPILITTHDTFKEFYFRARKYHDGFKKRKNIGAIIIQDVQELNQIDLAIFLKQVEIDKDFLLTLFETRGNHDSTCETFQMKEFFSQILSQHFLDYSQIIFNYLYSSSRNVPELKQYFKEFSLRFSKRGIEKSFTGLQLQSLILKIKGEYQLTALGKGIVETQFPPEIVKNCYDYFQSCNYPSTKMIKDLLFSTIIQSYFYPKFNSLQTNIISPRFQEFLLQLDKEKLELIQTMEPQSNNMKITVMRKLKILYQHWASFMKSCPLSWSQINEKRIYLTLKRFQKIIRAFGGHNNSHNLSCYQEKEPNNEKTTSNGLSTKTRVFRLLKNHPELVFTSKDIHEYASMVGWTCSMANLRGCLLDLFRKGKIFRIRAPRYATKPEYLYSYSEFVCNDFFCKECEHAYDNPIKKLKRTDGDFWCKEHDRSIKPHFSACSSFLEKTTFLKRIRDLKQKNGKLYCPSCDSLNSIGLPRFGEIAFCTRCSLGLRRGQDGYFESMVNPIFVKNIMYKREGHLFTKYNARKSGIFLSDGKELTIISKFKNLDSLKYELIQVNEDSKRTKTYFLENVSNIHLSGGLISVHDKKILIENGVKFNLYIFKNERLSVEYNGFEACFIHERAGTEISKYIIKFDQNGRKIQDEIVNVFVKGGELDKICENLLRNFKKFVKRYSQDELRKETDNAITQILLNNKLQKIDETKRIRYTRQQVQLKMQYHVAVFKKVQGLDTLQEKNMWHYFCLSSLPQTSIDELKGLEGLSEAISWDFENSSQVNNITSLARRKNRYKQAWGDGEIRAFTAYHSGLNTDYASLANFGRNILGNMGFNKYHPGKGLGPHFRQDKRGKQAMIFEHIDPYRPIFRWGYSKVTEKLNIHEVFFKRIDNLGREFYSPTKEGRKKIEGHFNIIKDKALYFDKWETNLGEVMQEDAKKLVSFILNDEDYSPTFVAWDEKTWNYINRKQKILKHVYGYGEPVILIFNKSKNYSLIQKDEIKRQILISLKENEKDLDEIIHSLPIFSKKFVFLSEILKKVFELQRDEIIMKKFDAFYLTSNAMELNLQK